MKHHLIFLGAVLCATIVDRLHGDSITEDGKLLKKWESYPQKVVAHYIQCRCVEN